MKRNDTAARVDIFLGLWSKTGAVIMVFDLNIRIWPYGQLRSGFGGRQFRPLALAANREDHLAFGIRGGVRDAFVASVGLPA
jgi:hypothetical protein